MRLIDADELKKCAIPCEIHNGALTDLCVPLYQIDNAPTVPLPGFDEIYKKGYHAGFYATHGEPDRLQGEWIVDNCGMYHCNHCMKEKQQLFNNFCANCGAQMGGGNNNGQN